MPPRRDGLVLGENDLYEVLALLTKRLEFPLQTYAGNFSLQLLICNLDDAIGMNCKSLFNSGLNIQLSLLFYLTIFTSIKNIFFP